MTTELIAVPVPSDKPRRAYKPRMSAQKANHQFDTLKKYGLDHEFGPHRDLVEQLCKALVEARSRKRYIREIIRDVARLFAK